MESTYAQGPGQRSTRTVAPGPVRSSPPGVLAQLIDHVARSDVDRTEGLWQFWSFIVPGLRAEEKK